MPGCGNVISIDGIMEGIIDKIIWGQKPRGGGQEPCGFLAEEDSRQRNMYDGMEAEAFLD